MLELYVFSFAYIFEKVNLRFQERSADHCSTKVLSSNRKLVTVARSASLFLQKGLPHLLVPAVLLCRTEPCQCSNIRPLTSWQCRTYLLSRKHKMHTSLQPSLKPDVPVRYANCVHWNFRTVDNDNAPLRRQEASGKGLYHRVAAR